MTIYKPAYLAFAEELADAARRLTLSYFRAPIDIEDKDDDSPVTVADRKTEALLRDLIAKRFPEHGIIGEECLEKVTSSDFYWVLDPIDGTRSFISGYPLYGTLIALFYQGKSIVSIIDMPALDERFLATSEHRTQLIKAGERHALVTRQQHDIGKSQLYSTDAAMFNSSEKEQLKVLEQQVALRRFNGDCYLYAMLAAGWIDLVVESDLHAYDFLPLKLIVEQAGGIITDWQGKALSKSSGGQVMAAATEALHQAAIAALNEGT